MKTLKLLTSVFMSLLLTICVFSQVVIADSGCTFYIENQTISSGDTFEVAIKVKNNKITNAYESVESIKKELKITD